MNPEDYETHFKLGFLYKQERKFDVAIKQFSMASSNPMITEKAMTLIQECLSSTVARKASLVYDDITYLKYEYPSLEDMVKKDLEMFYTLTLVESIPGLRKILDIGCGPGRYPLTFAFQGYDATGIDNSPQAIRKCNVTKQLEETRWGKLKLKFICMDGRKTTFEDSSFDLVTCMMGTIAHFSSGEKRDLLLEIRRILRNDGHLLISTWNPQYATARFLGFYRKRDRETLRQNLIGENELKNVLSELGFLPLEVIKFASLPDEFYFELDLDNLNKEDFQKIVMLESLVQKSFLSLECQLYLLHAQKKVALKQYRPCYTRTLERSININVKRSQKKEV